MPGFAFHWETLKQAAKSLSGGDDATAELLNSPYAALGALGPDILLYQPPSEQLASDLADGTIPTLLQQLTNDPASLLLQTPAVTAELQELCTIPFGCAYSLLFSLLVVPVWPLLTTIQAFMADLATAVASPTSQLSLKVTVVRESAGYVPPSAFFPRRLPSFTEAVLSGADAGSTPFAWISQAHQLDAWESRKVEVSGTVPAGAPSGQTFMFRVLQRAGAVVIGGYSVGVVIA